MPISALIGDTPVEHYQVPAARDPVLVAQLRDGGLISYARPDGTYTHTHTHTHTLNTPAGFDRKLRQLGITGSTEIRAGTVHASG